MKNENMDEFQRYRRKFGKIVAGLGLSPVLIQPSPANAFIGLFFRLFLRASVRSAFRSGGRFAAGASRSVGMRPIVRAGAGVGTGGYGGRALGGVWDGFTLIDSLSALSSPDIGIVAVSNRVARQAQKYDADTIWIAGHPSRVRIDFINDSDVIIPKPRVYFEQVNLATGEQHIRPNPLKFLNDWYPGVSGSIPDQSVPPDQLLPMTIAEAGPIAIRPFVDESPDVIFDQFVIQVVSRSDIQWRNS